MFVCFCPYLKLEKILIILLIKAYGGHGNVEAAVLYTIFPRSWLPSLLSGKSLFCVWAPDQSFRDMRTNARSLAPLSRLREVAPGEIRAQETGRWGEGAPHGSQEAAAELGRGALR